jgi:hypothetical protein
MVILEFFLKKDMKVERGLFRGKMEGKRRLWGVIVMEVCSIKV